MTGPRIPIGIAQFVMCDVPALCREEWKVWWGSEEDGSGRFALDRISPCMTAYILMWYP